MAGDVNPIYQRLNSVEDYHPFTASTFADCSLEAGDIISINRGGATFSGPTQTNTIKWTGQQQVTVEAPGEQTRGSVARMSAERYNSGGGGGNSYRSGYRRNTREELIGAKIRENADNIEIEAWNREQADNTFEASLKVQANKIEAEVKNRKAGDEELSGKIQIEAGKVEQIVTAVGSDGKVTAASIMTAINGDKSEVRISAGKIYLNGDTTINDIFEVNSSGITAKRALFINTQGSVTQIGGGYVLTDSIMLSGKGKIATIMQSTVENMIIDARLSADEKTLYLYKFSDRLNPITFKKATSLSGSWSGSTGDTATFTYQTDDTSIPAESTYLELRQSGSYVVAYDPSGAPRARVSAGGSSYSHDSVLVYDHFDDEDEVYYYRSEDLITRQSVGASKTVYYN